MDAHTFGGLRDEPTPAEAEFSLCRWKSSISTIYRGVLDNLVAPVGVYYDSRCRGQGSGILRKKKLGMSADGN